MVLLKMEAAFYFETFLITKPRSGKTDSLDSNTDCTANFDSCSVIYS
jgi:hypothetical protein